MRIPLFSSFDPETRNIFIIWIIRKHARCNFQIHCIIVSDVWSVRVRVFCLCTADELAPSWRGDGNEEEIVCAFCWRELILYANIVCNLLFKNTFYCNLWFFSYFASTSVCASTLDPGRWSIRACVDAAQPTEESEKWRKSAHELLKFMCVSSICLPLHMLHFTGRERVRAVRAFYAGIIGYLMSFSRRAWQ